MNSLSNQKSKTSNPLLLAFALVTITLLLVGALLVFKPFQSNKTSPGSGASLPTKEEKQQQTNQAAQDKSAYLDETSKSRVNSTQNSSNTAVKSLSLSTLVNGDSVTVLTQIYNVSSGECVLAATNSGQTITQKATVLYESRFSSCAGFTVPVSSLGKGSWQISVSVTLPDNTQLSKENVIEVR